MVAKAKTDLLDLSAVELRDRLASGALKAVDLAKACLDRILALEPQIGAWAYLDPDHVMKQAEMADRYRATGRPIGPLHGLPVGIKDIIDTAKMPTENGTGIDSGRIPTEDAFVVARLKAAGAIIMGKTVTTELAYIHPPRTKNPNSIVHTPGGSSSGSAAAVASGMVPLAIGTQTGGSVIRPASFCGVTGFKPTFGAIPRSGILKQSQTLDTVGVFGRGPLDAALIAEVLFGGDPADPATSPTPHPQLLKTASEEAPVRPVFALVTPPGWDDADPEMKEAFAELAEALGEDQCFEMARNYYTYARAGADKLSPEMQAALQEGSATLAKDYLAALDWSEVYYAGLKEIFGHADVILTPAATGPAPKDLTTTGSAIFNGLWTLVGTPAVTIPVLTSQGGMPMGIQLVGPRGYDGRLLRSARWLWNWIDEQSQ
jgi:Asp-tRNA(Asn)/Glu-tRNA(Gln) amidotransferase A subunit family amidase